MATATRPIQQLTEASEAITSENAYEVIDGVPVGRPVDDPERTAYEEAYEVVDGKILEWPVMGAYPEEVASILLERLGPHVRHQGLGRAIVEPRIGTIGGRERRPDVAFFSFARMPKGRRAPDDATWGVIPDLAVEVLSKNDKAWEVMAKVREYFDAGVIAVWLVYPSLEMIHVYSAFNRIEVVTRAETLDGGAVVPGFRLPLVELFEEETEPEAAVDVPEPGPTA